MKIHIRLLCLPLMAWGLFMLNPAHAALLDVANYSARVTASALNVRSGPSTNYSVLGTVTRDQVVTVTHHDGSWRKISWGGRSGYAYGSYLLKTGSPTPPPTNNDVNVNVNVSDYRARVNANTLNVRSGPGTHYSVVGSRTRNATVTVTHHNGIWRKIGTNAYVHGNYIVRFTSTPTPTPTPTPPPTPSGPPPDYNVTDYNGLITAGALSVRSGPGLNYGRIGYVYRNKIVRVTHHNGIWRKILWANGRRAYVYGSYVQKINPGTAPVRCDIPTMRTYTQTALESARNFKKQFTQFINNPADAATIAQCGTVSGSLGVVGGGATACQGIDSGLRLGVIGTLGGGIVVGGGVSGGVGVMASNSSISSLSGWGVCGGGTIAPIGGADGELCTGLKKSTTPGNCTWVSNGVLQGYLGASAGGEINGSLTLTKTWTKDAGWRDVYNAVIGLTNSGSQIVRKMATAIWNRIKQKIPFL